MIKYKMLMNDDPENLGGDGVDTGVEIQPGDELMDVGGEPTQPAPVVEKAAPVPKQVELTDERIAEISARVLAKNNAATAGSGKVEEQEQQLTPEEIEKLLNPVKVSREDMAELFGIEDPATISDKRLQKFQALLQATVKNSNSVSNVMIEARMRKLMEQAAPMEQFYRQQEAERQKATFYSRHENLKQYGRLVQAAAAQVQATPGMTAEQAMDAIATAAKAMLKEAGIDPDAAGDNSSSGSDTTHGADSSKGVPKMASLQKSGRGTGPAKNGASNNPDADIYN